MVLRKEKSAQQQNYAMRGQLRLRISSRGKDKEKSAGHQQVNLVTWPDGRRSVAVWLAEVGGAWSLVRNRSQSRPIIFRTTVCRGIRCPPGRRAWPSELGKKIRPAPRWKESRSLIQERRCAPPHEFPPRPNRILNSRGTHRSQEHNGCAHRPQVQISGNQSVLGILEKSGCWWVATRNRSVVQRGLRREKNSRAKLPRIKILHEALHRDGQFRGRGCACRCAHGVACRSASLEAGDGKCPDRSRSRWGSPRIRSSGAGRKGRAAGGNFHHVRRPACPRAGSIGVVKGGDYPITRAELEIKRCWRPQQPHFRLASWDPHSGLANRCRNGGSCHVPGALRRESRGVREPVNAAAIAVHKLAAGEVAARPARVFPGHLSIFRYAGMGRTFCALTCFSSP